MLFEITGYVLKPITLIISGVMNNKTRTISARSSFLNLGFIDVHKNEIDF